MNYPNRLNLNFQLSTREERVDYVNSYLSAIKFQPTTAELETISNYILWGKNSSGQNGRQEGLDIETKNHTWDTQKTESLDALLDSPTFSECSVRQLTSPAYKSPHSKFSRSEIRETAPSSTLPLFEELWRNIDSTELQINLYELAHSLRTKPIRPSLLSSFTSSEISEFTSLSSHLNSYTYLKLRHQLVELRREQYTLKDTFSSPISLHQLRPPLELWDPEFGSEINVLPLSIPNSSTLSSKIFRKDRFPEPQDFTQDDLTQLSTLLWSPKTSNLNFDFTNPEHLYQLIYFYTEFREEKLSFSSTLPQFLDLMDVYVSLADLKPLHKDILDLKLAHASNQAINSFIKTKYSHSYNLNYISTIFCKTILPKIAETARLHYEVCQNLFFPENFKTCLTCGRTLLKDPNNFMRKAKVKDGFAPHCKHCQHKMKQED